MTPSDRVRRMPRRTIRLARQTSDAIARDAPRLIKTNGYLRAGKHCAVRPAVKAASTDRAITDGRRVCPRLAVAPGSLHDSLGLARCDDENSRPVMPRAARCSHGGTKRQLLHP